MKKFAKWMALVLVLTMALSMAACGKEEEQDAVAESDSKYQEVTAGGSIDITPVEELDTGARISCVPHEGELYVSFNGIQNKSTDYFQPGSSTITVVCKTTSDAPVIPTYRLSLWMLTDDRKAQYVEDGMALVDADGSCYSITFSGLDTNRKYKLTMGYAATSYYISGLMKVSPLAVDELTVVD